MRSNREKGLVGTLAVIPEINFSVNVGKNVVGSEENAHERAGIKVSE